MNRTERFCAVTRCADLGAVYPTFRTCNYNGFRVATNVANVHHFHCVSKRNVLAKLSHELTVPIWRLPNIRDIEWKLLRSYLLAKESYGEPLPCSTMHPNDVHEADCNNNASGLNYNSLLMVANGWSPDGDSLASTDSATVPAMLAFTDSLSVIQTMCRLFSNMEQSLDELRYTFANIVDTVGATNVTNMGDKKILEDETFQH